MISCVVSFLFGVCSLCLFSDIPSIKLVLSLCFTLGILSCFKKFRVYKLHWFLAYLMGFLWVSSHALFHLEHRLPEIAENIPIEIVGSVHNLPEGRENSRFEFNVEYTSPAYLWPNPGRIRLCFNHPPEQLHVGDRFAFTVKLKRPNGYANPGSFDKERHSFLNRISAEGYVVSKYPVTHLQKHSFFEGNISDPRALLQVISTSIHQLRGKIFSAIFNCLENSPFAGIVAALVVGTREGIRVEQWEVFRNTGTGHLIAISGLHVGLVATLAFGLIKFIYRWLPESYFRIPVQIVGAYVAIVAAISYALLAGFTVPTQRAVVMVTVFMLSIIFRRRTSVWQSYFLALGIVIVIDPLSCLGVGFWLSFSAVGVIIYGMQNRIAPRGMWYRWGRAQWVVFLGLAPISLAAFQQMSWVSPLANLIAIPWVSTFVVPFALLGGTLIPLFPKVGGFFLLIADISLRVLWPFLEKSLSIFSKVTWTPAQASLISLGFSILGIALLLAPKGFPARKLSIIFLLPLLLNTTPKIEPGALRFTLLDVGQGLSAIIETEKHVLVFDTGPRLNEHVDTGQQVVLPFLAAEGKSKIDSIIISHADNDHVGGLSSITKKMTVEKILSSEPEKIVTFIDPEIDPEKSNIHQCYAGQKWTWDGVDFEILHPSSAQSKKRNDRSCVLRVQAGEHVVLVTGDIESSAEKLLIEHLAQKLTSSILVVPHHGSKTSSSPEFIKAVDPDYAIFPVGYKNAYGHPRPEILARYSTNSSKGVRLLNTVKDGAVRFELKPNVPLDAPLCYRTKNQRFWHRN